MGCWARKDFMGGERGTTTCGTGEGGRYGVSVRGEVWTGGDCAWKDVCQKSSFQDVEVVWGTIVLRHGFERSGEVDISRRTRVLRRETNLFNVSWWEKSPFIRRELAKNVIANVFSSSKGRKDSARLVWKNFLWYYGGCEEGGWHPRWLFV